MFCIFFKSCCIITPILSFQVSTPNQKKQYFCFYSGRPDVWKIQFAQTVCQQIVYQHAYGAFNQLTQNYLSFIQYNKLDSAFSQKYSYLQVRQVFKIQLNSKVIIVSMFSRPDTWGQLCCLSMCNVMSSHLTCFRVYNTKESAKKTQDQGVTQSQVWASSNQCR